jgi:hypothetical protein
MPELLHELEADDRKGQNKAKIKGCQDPTTGEDPFFREILERIKHISK